MNTTIYLIGHISGDLGSPEKNPTFLWRSEIRKYFADAEDIVIIDPCNTNFDTKFCKDDPADNQRMKSYRKKTASILLPKSRLSVKKADLIIANLNTFGSESVSTGTLMELAWAYDQSHTTVIGIYNEAAHTKGDITGHPFVQGIVDIFTTTPELACTMVNDLFRTRGS